MIDFERDRYSDPECIDAFRELFSLGLAGADVIAEIAPKGRDRSPLVAAVLFRNVIQGPVILGKTRHIGGGVFSAN